MFLDVGLQVPVAKHYVASLYTHSAERGPRAFGCTIRRHHDLLLKSLVKRRHFIAAPCAQLLVESDS